MNKRNLFERIKRKFEMGLVPVMSRYRRRLINNKDFTIISNNCWAGYVYRYFGLPYNTPTVGLYFFADDYIKFVNNLEYYISCDLKIIESKESKHFDSLKKNKQEEVPVGKLDDIEVIFLHYKNKEEAKQKWQRRIKRINWNNLIIKFSEMNNCKEEHLLNFDKLPYNKKIMFVSKQNHIYKSGIYYKGYEDIGQVKDDVFYWNKYIDIVRLINEN